MARSTKSLLFSRLNSHSSLSFSWQDWCSIPLMISIAVHILLKLQPTELEQRLPAKGQSHFPWPASHASFDTFSLLSLLLLEPFYPALGLYLTLLNLLLPHHPTPSSSSRYPVSLFPGFSCGIKPIFPSMEWLQRVHMHFLPQNKLLGTAVCRSWTIQFHIQFHRHVQKTKGACTEGPGQSSKVLAKLLQSLESVNRDGATIFSGQHCYKANIFSFFCLWPM